MRIAGQFFPNLLPQLFAAIICEIEEHMFQTCTITADTAEKTQHWSTFPWAVRKKTWASVFTMLIQNSLLKWVFHVAIWQWWRRKEPVVRKPAFDAKKFVKKRLVTYSDYGQDFSKGTFNSVSMYPLRNALKKQTEADWKYTCYEEPLQKFWLATEKFGCIG